MKRHIIFVFASMILLAMLSCKKAGTNPAFDDNIKIRMTETVDSVHRTLRFICATEKIYTCSNFGIETTCTLANDRITINFISINTHGICLTSLGPASAVINLNGLANKTYEMVLNSGADKITGQLTVTTGGFVATLPAQTKVQFVNPDLKRVPANTVYGTVHYHSMSTDTTVQKFIDSLRSYGATPASYLPGDYGQFQTDANGQIRQTQDPGYYFTRYYIFSYSNGSAQRSGQAFWCRLFQHAAHYFIYNKGGNVL